MATQNAYEKDLYGILGVAKNDNITIIKKAYRKLAKDLHPDKNKGDKKLEERFKEVSEAYDILSDPNKRAEYDERQSLLKSGGSSSPRAYSSRASGQPNLHPDDMSEFFGYTNEDIFSSFFGSAGTQTRGRGNDLQSDITISFRDAIIGKEMTLTLPEASIKVRIPSGVNDGAKIKVKGRGAKGSSQNGDLILIVHVSSHPVYVRKDNDLFMNLPITFPEATLGAEISIPTFYGERIKVKINPGTQSGKVLRIKGKGIDESYGIGDLFIKIEILVPQQLDSKAIKALEKFAELESDVSARTELYERAKA